MMQSHAAAPADPPRWIVVNQTTIIATTADPDGRSVVLTDQCWDHIRAGHPELVPYQLQVLAAVHTPSHRRAGRWVGEEWFYLATTHPSRWLKVVVRYEAGRGHIVTAFPRRSLP